MRLNLKLVAFAGLFSLNASAVDLLTATGTTGTFSCMTPPNVVTDAARVNALQKLGSLVNYQNVSKWYEGVQINYWPNGLCQSVSGWSYAAFVPTAQIFEDWFVTAKGVAEPNFNDGPVGDALGWGTALQESLKWASFYCGGKVNTTALSVYNAKTSDGHYETIARYKCIKP